MADDSDFSAPCAEMKNGVRCMLFTTFHDGDPQPHEHSFPIAQRPPVSPEQYAIRFRPPGRAVWRYVDYPDLPTAVEEFGDYADETHPQIVKRTEPEAWREVSLNEAQERFSFAREVQAGLDRQGGADHG